VGMDATSLIPQFLKFLFNSFSRMGNLGATGKVAVM